MSTHSTPHIRRHSFWALAITVIAALGSWATIALADSWPTRPYYYFLHWVSMGQLDCALAQFADDAVVVAGPLCTEQRPCVGRADIRARYLLPLLAGRSELPVANARFDGQVLRAQGELAYESRVHESGQRRGAEHMFEFRDGHISSLHAETDSAVLTYSALKRNRSRSAARRGSRAAHRLRADMAECKSPEACGDRLNPRRMNRLADFRPAEAA